MRNETFQLFLKLFCKSKISSKYNYPMAHSFKAILLESNKVIKFYQVHWACDILTMCCVIQNHRILQFGCSLGNHNPSLYS